MVYISLNGINSVDQLCSRFNLAKLKLSNKPKSNNNIADDSLNVISAFSDLLSKENQKKVNATLRRQKKIVAFTHAESMILRSIRHIFSCKITFHL